MDSIIVIGDVHGCKKTLEALVKQLPHRNICFSGDLVDRGPDSAGVVRYVRGNNWLVTSGNHEVMMSSSVLENIGVIGWLKNGGAATLNSYKKEPLKYIGESPDIWKDLEEEIMHDDIKWMNSLPVYLEFPELKLENGRHLVVSHSHVCNVWCHKDTKEEYLKERFEEEILWGRPHKLNQKYNQDIYNIIGHTPVKQPRIKELYSNIDTGCFHNSYGELTALQFPEMKLYWQKCIDEVEL